MTSTFNMQRKIRYNYKITSKHMKKTLSSLKYIRKNPTKKVFWKFNILLID